MKHERTRRLAALLAAVAVAGLASSAMRAPRAQSAQAEQVGETRGMLEQWVETRRLLSQEKRDGQLGRELLGDRIGLVQREIEALRGKLAEAQASISAADEKRAELAAENERLKSSAATLEGTVAGLEQRTRELLARLPVPIVERVKPLSQRFPSGPDASGSSLSARFQNIVGILNEVNRFHREISLASEVRELGGGQSAEVTALYVGISQGYYANASGTAAGIGTPTETGWLWTPADEHAAEIAKAIAIRKNEASASYALLPIRLDP